MFPSHAEQKIAIALQLAACLDAYEQDLDKLPLDSASAERHAALADRFDEMQMYATSLPELSVSWLTLMISRAEFTHNVWLARERGRAGGLQLLLDEHRDALEGMRARCARMARRA